jgi:hypothetical protein
MLAAAQSEPEPQLEATADDIAYEPDQEKRDRFLSRFSRWAKKGN